MVADAPSAQCGGGKEHSRAGHVWVPGLWTEAGIFAGPFPRHFCEVGSRHHLSFRWRGLVSALMVRGSNSRSAVLETVHHASGPPIAPSRPRKAAGLRGGTSCPSSAGGMKKAAGSGDQRPAIWRHFWPHDVGYHMLSVMQSVISSHDTGRCHASHPTWICRGPEMISGWCVCP